MLSTPSTTPVEKHVPSVYMPAEDTFLLLDALEADRDLLTARRPAVCWEIGYVAKAYVAKASGSDACGARAVS